MFGKRLLCAAFPKKAWLDGLPTITESFKYYLVLLSYTMEAVSLKLENEFLHDIEKTMKKHRYTTKTEFIREAIRDKIKDLEKEELLMKAKKLYGS